MQLHLGHLTSSILRKKDTLDITIMCIVELPSEILLHVASFASQTDLLNLSLTCKRLRNVTESELYREYINVLSFVDPAKPVRSLQNFLLHLLKRPELAKHVRKVHIRTLSHLSDLDPHEGLLEYVPLTECTSDDYARLTQAAVAAGIITDVLPYDAENGILQQIESIKYQMDWISDDIGDYWWDQLYDSSVKTEDIPYDVQFCKLLRLGIDDPFIVLLMALLPNIRELTLGKTPYQCYALRWRVSHGFKALRRFTAWPCTSKLEWPQEPNNLFGTVLAGGNVEFLEIAWGGCALPLDGIDFEEQDEVIPVPILLKPKSTSITSLRLVSCTFTKDEMNIILQACAPLKSLYYLVGGPSIGPENFTLPDLIELLQPHKGSLEKLYLDLDEDWDMDPKIESLPTLCDFTALKTLDTNMHTWRDILLQPRDENLGSIWFQDMTTEPLQNTTRKLCDLLPPSLRTFVLHETIRENMSENLDFRQLEHFVLKSNTALPNLTSFYLREFQQGTLQQIHNRFDALVAVANSDDDDFQFVVLPWDEYLVLNQKLFESEKESEQAMYSQRWSGDRYRCDVPKPGRRDMNTC